MQRRNLTNSYEGYDLIGAYAISRATIKERLPLDKLKKEGSAEMVMYLFLNERKMSQRIITLSNYNPAARFSTELYDQIWDVCAEMQEILVREDRNFMWENFDLINHLRLKSFELKALTSQQRREKLDQIEADRKKLLLSLQTTSETFN
jgi:hypothetical protein